MLTADFDYELPAELIAQHPPQERDGSRLLVLHRETRQIEHRQFLEFPSLLRPDDVLVLNDTRVLPARLRGVKAATGGKTELLLVKENLTNDWWVMLKPGRRVRRGTAIQLLDLAGHTCGIQACVSEKNPEGLCQIQFRGTDNIRDALASIGEMPLPPYISREAHAGEAEDRARYQTIYARQNGSVAAPTAGLHFTDRILAELQARGVELHHITLHVGLGTFAPVKTERAEVHQMHAEWYSIGSQTAQAIAAARRDGRRIVAVGTTTLRALESAAARPADPTRGITAQTDIFIRPPFQFRAVDALLTNFHLPRSTLLMLVSAFATPGALEGSGLVLAAYAEAIRARYRFFSYGDAMLIT